MDVDFGRTAEDYARHRQGFPPRFFEVLEGRGVVHPDDRVVDLGTGTGTLAHGFAERGCEVVGLDASAEMVEAARTMGDVARFHVGPAENTELAAGAWDLVTAGQCWHWFDRPAAAREAWRLLAPHGWLVICHLDWLVLPDGVVEASVALRPERRSALSFAHDGLYPRWLTDAREAGFVDLETFSFDLDLLYTHEAWRGRMRASAWVGAVSETDVAAFDSALTSVLAERFPEDPVAVPHRVFAMLARKPG